MSRSISPVKTTALLKQPAVGADWSRMCWLRVFWVKAPKSRCPGGGTVAAR